MKRLLKSKTIKFFSDLWFKYIKKPYLNYLERKQKAEFDRKVIKSFKKQFGVHPDEVKKLIISNEKIYWGKKPNIKLTNEEYKEFLVKELKKSAKPNNGVPCFYEPEIIDIHNESIADRKGENLKSLIKHEQKIDSFLLDQKEKKLNSLR